MKLEQHPSYDRLADWEQELCQNLVESTHLREVLPFRVDSRIFDAVIVAAECVPISGAILVVASKTFATSWVDAWERRGRRPAKLAKTRATGPEVVVATIDDLKRNEASFKAIVYSAIIVAGCVEAEDVGWVASQLEYNRAWHLTPQPASSTPTWPLGVAGRALFLDHDAPYTFQPTVRSRPSVLAERVAA
jgi:hypothetical protein